jgi:Neurotransmitter-gated ion-channel transmembrane region
MNLTSPTDAVNLDSYSRNGEWEVLGTGARRNEFTYSGASHQHDPEIAYATMTTSGRPIPTTPSVGGSGERFSSIAFAIQLRRRHLFYVMNVIMPSVMTSVLLLSVFFCTPGQKVQIGVVVLLSFRIFLLNVAENIPKTSDHVPLLGKYV